MAKYCGGFNLGDKLSVINGIICKAGTESVDATKAITTCSQLFDGETFKVVNGIITTVDAEDAPVSIKCSCALMLDSNVFDVTKNEVNLKEVVDPKPEGDA